MTSEIETELRRYVAYLQRSLMTPGFEGVAIVAAQSDRAREYIERLRNDQSRANDTRLLDSLEQLLNGYKPSFEFDSFFSSRIFSAILAEVLDAANELALAPKRRVLLATSTDLSFTPAVRTGDGDHIVFAGMGTSLFCNYWGKLLSHIITASTHKFGTARFTDDHLKRLFQLTPNLAIDAAKFAIACRSAGSCVGYGEMSNWPEAVPYRIELVRAMETFAIAHEVGHCYLAEKSDITSAHSPDKQELFCDRFAILVGRSIGNKHKDWLRFCGAGGLLFLRLAGLCTPIEKLTRCNDDRTHPDPASRGQRCMALSVSETAIDQVEMIRGYLTDLDVICTHLELLVSDVLS